MRKASAVGVLGGVQLGAGVNAARAQREIRAEGGGGDGEVGFDGGIVRLNHFRLASAAVNDNGDRDPAAPGLQVDEGDTVTVAITAHGKSAGYPVSGQSRADAHNESQSGTSDAIGGDGGEEQRFGLTVRRAFGPFDLGLNLAADAGSVDTGRLLTGEWRF